MGAYCTISDLRDEGLLDADADATRVQALIDHFSGQIDDWCGQFFDSRTITHEATGRGTVWLHLPVPIVAVTAVRQVWHTSSPATTYTLSATQYRAYNRSYPDDRRNPKIKRLGAKWEKGGTYEIDGTFGFLVPDGSSWKTPPQIRHACMLLVSHWAPRVADPDGLIERRQVDLESVSVRGRSERYGGPDSFGTLSGLPEVDRILFAYQTPLRMRGV